MNRFERALVALVRGTGLFQVLLGLSFWVGYLLRLIPLHMFVGLLFTLALFTLAVRGLLVRETRGLAAFTAAWSVIVIVFGMAQAQILPGEYHWVIRLLHLLVGAAAMGLAANLATRLSRVRASSAPSRGEAIAQGARAE